MLLDYLTLLEEDVEILVPPAPQPIVRGGGGGRARPTKLRRRAPTPAIHYHKRGTVAVLVAADGVMATRRNWLAIAKDEDEILMLLDDEM